MFRRAGADYFNPDEATARILAANPGMTTAEANSAAWHEGKRLLEHAIANAWTLRLKRRSAGTPSPLFSSRRWRLESTCASGSWD
jgi:hypothetical protein